MQVSRSLADFMDRLDAGPQGAADALSRIEDCSQAKSNVLDLQQMNLSDDDLQTILPSLGKLADHVTELNLFMNEISVLPAELGVLSNLRILHAGANPLEQISPGFLSAFPDLVELDIGFSELLETMPDEFQNMKSLRVLLAGNGRLRELPASLFSCSNLEELFLYGNSLDSLSADVGKLKKLRVLNLGRNQIRSLPKSLAECARLEKLQVYENCLSELPPGLDKITALAELNVMSNEAMPRLPRHVRAKACARETAAFLSGAC